MATPRRPRPVVLCVLDGWGDSTETDDNAILRGETPHWDRFVATCPRARLDASAEAVGLPAGQMGNSEVGHTNLGAGRVVLQDLPRINEAVATGALAENPRLTGFLARLKETGGTCHLMGLVSPGGVHSHQDHIAALARAAAAAGVPVALHAFLDGRDTPPKSAEGYLRTLLDAVGALPGLRVATVGGRYYAMDRDKRWERTARAYAALTDAEGVAAPDALAAVARSYADKATDEFVLPTVVDGYRGMADGDGILMANFRADRARQILAALLDPDFHGFTRPRRIDFAAALGMVSYSDELDPFMDALFPPPKLDHILGALVAEAGLRQLRIAETEKYAHVTFFFNGGAERRFEGEDRILVPSPKVATYDLQPEMSADEVTDKLVAAIAEDRYDFILVNYANPDMVGHTGVMSAALAAVAAVDRCLGRLADAVTEAGGALLITADHGNIEQMRDEATGQAHTAHTTDPVPIVLVNGPAEVRRLSDGRLADVAPTLLALLGLPQPAEMTGKSLLVGAPATDTAERARATT